MHDLTILEAARALGYSKNAVKYQVAKLPADLVYKDDKGVTRLKPAAIKELRQIMGNKQPANNQQTTTQETDKQPDNNHETTTQETALYNALLQTIETLTAQLETKDKQIEALTSTLQAAQQSAAHAQALHAGTMQAALIESRPATAEAETRRKGWQFWKK